MRRRALLRAAGTVGLAGPTALPVAGSVPAERVAGRPGSPGRATGQTFEPAGRVPVSNDTSRYQAAEAVATDDGEHAFVSKVDGFHVVDVGSPAAPEIVETREDILAGDDGPLRDILDLKYDDGRLLVAAPGNPGGTFEGVVLFDVADPADPTIEAVYRTNHNVHNCFLDGRYAYLTAGDAVEIVDVDAPAPEQVAEWSLTDHESGYADLPAGLRNVHDVYVRGDRAYFAYWDAGTWILDVSDPADPGVLGRVGDRTLDDLLELSNREAREQTLEPPGNAHYVQPGEDGLLAVGKESWGRVRDDGTVRGGPSGIDLWDVSDPTAPEKLGAVDPPAVPEGEDPTYGGYWTTAHNFDLAGGHLYSSWYRGGVRIHDVSDPSDPTEVAAWADRDEASFWTAQAAVPGESLIASSFRNPGDPDAPGGLYVFRDPTERDVPDTTETGDPRVTRRTESPPATETATAATRSPSRSDPAATSTEPEDAGNRSVTTGDGPGFGLLAGATALGIGAWRSLRGERQ